MKSIKTRFAPSPTGFLHIGGVRTALFCYLFAKKNKGQFILRIEDTDTDRNVQKASAQIIKALNWLGFELDDSIFYQSQRQAIYQKYLQQLLEEKKAYVCQCSKQRLDKLRQEALKHKLQPKYDGYCADKNLSYKTKSIVRLKVSNQGQSEFIDEIRGKLTIHNEQLDDLIIWRDQMPTYNFAVVIDDSLMQISHIIRGDDHINNTFRQLAIFAALNFSLPSFTHLPMILDAKGAKLSKRNEAANVLNYQNEGYLPQALINFLFRLGYAYKDQEIFSLKQMIDLFELKKINLSSANFDLDKLNWFNAHYLKQKTTEQLWDLLQNDYAHQLPDTMSLQKDKNIILTMLEMQKVRANTLIELANLCTIFYQKTDINPLIYEQKTLEKITKNLNHTQYQAIMDCFKNLTDFSVDNIHQQMQLLVQSHFAGKFAQFGLPLRLILTANHPTGDLAKVCSFIGQKEVLTRLEYFYHHYQKYIKNT